nr:DNA double-strand break repair nuclease NurA [Anaerolineae bacterium]
MTLEFHKLTVQVDRMGEYLASLETENEDKVELALQIMQAYGDEAFLPQILERVQDAVAKDAGYRGARPIDEPIVGIYPPAPLPETATVVATDGSQIPPDSHGAATYYLINTGTMTLHHGSGQPPEIASEPALFYESEYIQIDSGGSVTATTVAARRTVAEMAKLAEHGWLMRGEARPLVALLDNPLLLIGMGHEVPDREQLRRLYFSAMTRLMDIQAGLGGYTDRPRSRYVTGMLHLLDMDSGAVNRRTLSDDGRLEGLMDRAIFSQLLNPGERSALFVQMSPLNKDFKDQGGDTHEIAFFYLNTAGVEQFPTIARVEVPMWVARDRGLIAEMQALIFHQCQQTGSRYPYVLTRAHELAVVKYEEAQQLKLLIRISLTRHGIEASDSQKQAGKDSVSGKRSRFRVS